MTYCTQNRNNQYFVEYWDPTAKYTGHASWWPDFGHGGRDFSHQKEHDCVGYIFDNVTFPQKRQPPQSPLPKQFRHPCASTEALMIPSRREAVAALGPQTRHQCELNRLEARAQRIDSWLEDPPVLSRIGSEPSLSSKKSVEQTTALYDHHGWLRKQHCTHKRRLLPPKKNTVIFANQILNQPRKPALPSKPSKQWMICPENPFTYSRQLNLPVPKNGAPDLLPWLELPWEWGKESTLQEQPSLDKTRSLPSEPSTMSTELPQQDSLQQDSFFTQSVQSTADSLGGDSL
eukprot:gnl/MRDRNA2_/MRDRNA2_38329_c0_seq1.p1 gnl/MRDRNA2_/MRDRNA2_38329_c0~~gnl/MRDRNA2_/MRDRNA2_38329_c0_seq1.p1  ORF type:complete len:289 (+),score=43.54 gnl/MRDRNA2_/MRDRNA2_38329_c0_seq1:96-962(+)